MIEVELKIDEYNNKKYYIKGTYIYHKEDGPAIEYDNGDKYWIQSGQYHRIDGPAVEGVNGDKCWYLDGQRMNCQTQKQFEKSKEYRKFKLKAFW